MKARVGLASLAALLLPAATWGTDPEQTERKALEGTWVCLSSEVNGVKRNEKESKPQSIHFKGDRYRQADADSGAVDEGTYQLDLSGKQKVMTTLFKSGQKDLRVRYIFERTGDTLKMCCHLLPDKELPTEYAAPEGSKRAFLVFKRVKE